MLQGIVDTVYGWVWSVYLVYFCLGAGILFSILTKFVQIRKIPHAVRLLFGGGSSQEGVSSLQAFSMALSGRVGTGNIAGVATAIASGGPGSIFWMWAIALLGSASAYVESTLSQIYKEEIDGEYRGGPAYYIRKGLGIRWFAVLFSVVTIIAAGVFMPGNQAFNIADGLENAFGLSPLISGILICIPLAIIIFGGTKRIGRFAEIIVPFMAGAYIIIALIIILLNIQKLPNVFSLIFSSAFGLHPLFGGILGSAVSWGVKRGIYSNEAGQGTGAIASGAAEVSHPVKQGLVQSISVYVDTLLVCSATAFIILITDSYNVVVDKVVIVENNPTLRMGASFTQAAVDTFLKGFGGKFVSIALFFFAFTTIMAYYYQGESNLMYVIKTHKTRIRAKFFFRILFLGFVFWSTGQNAKLIWGMADIGVGAMAWINLIAITLLCKPALIALKDYETQLKQGLDPVFQPETLGIQNASLWNKISKKYLANRKI